MWNIGFVLNGNLWNAGSKNDFIFKWKLNNNDASFRWNYFNLSPFTMVLDLISSLASTWDSK